jgi:hypothetical protein
MKNASLDSTILYQKAFIGGWSLELHPKEMLILKLRFAPREKILDLWAELWHDIYDYDELPPACRALMPTVIRRMQTENVSEDWKIIHGLDLSFLVGLPRYVWTRNKFMLNQTKRIASHVGEAGIEIVAIKGMADLISDAHDGMMRSTVDLDLLIRPEDFDLFKNKMSEIGFELQLMSEGASLMLSDQFQFVPTDGTNSFVDLHLMANKYQEDDRLTTMIWKGKVPSNVCPTLFLPSDRERFWLSVANAFRLQNWQYESHLKYLNDALNYLSVMNTENMDEVLKNGENLQLLQDWQEQVIQLGCDLDILKSDICTSQEKTYERHNHSNGTIKRLLNDKLSSVTLHKLRYPIILLDIYIQTFRARNIKGNYWKVMRYLSVGIPYKAILFIWRSLLSKISSNRSIPPLHAQLNNMKIRDVKWYF